MAGRRARALSGFVARRNRSVGAGDRWDDAITPLSARRVFTGGGKGSGIPFSRKRDPGPLFRGASVTGVAAGVLERFAVDWHKLPIVTAIAQMKHRDAPRRPTDLAVGPH